MSIFYRAKGMRRSVSAMALLSAGILGGSLAALPARGQGITVTVAGIARSTVRGWGIYPDKNNGGQAAENTFGRPAIQEAQYGMGVTFLREQLSQRYYKSGTTAATIQFHDTADPGWSGFQIDDLVRQLQVGRSHGVSEYILAAWSPPVAFKTLDSLDGTAAGVENGYYWDGTHNRRSFLRRDKEQAFCEWYVAALQYLNSHGVGLPSYISVQNEPSMWHVDYEGCYMLADQWRRVVKTMRQTLDAHGMSAVRIFGSDDTYTANFSSEWNASPAPAGYLNWNFTALDSDTVLDAALPAFAFHTYDVGFQTGTTGGVARYPRDIWMTEWNDEKRGDAGGNDGIGRAVRTARHLAADFTTLPYSRWCYFFSWNRTNNGVLPAGGLLGGDTVPTYNPAAFLLHEVWNNVRPGWVTKTISSSDPDLNPTPDSNSAFSDSNVGGIAFEEPNGNASAVLLVNATGTDKLNVTVSGLKGAQADVLQTTASQNMAVTQAGTVSTGGAFSISVLPARSITLLETHTDLDNRSYNTVWTPTASNSNDNAPNNAVDGTMGTAWESNTEQQIGQWFQIRMPAAQTFSSLTMDTGPTHTDHYPRAFAVQVSNDGTTWGNYVARGVGVGRVTRIRFAPQTARYVRITLTEDAATFGVHSWWSIAELSLSR